MKTFLFTLVASSLFTACAQRPASQNNEATSKQTIQTMTQTNNQKNSNIYFAGGCFWGTEHFFKQIHGVIATEVGYANGKTSNPTYDEVKTGETGFAETVKVTYSPQLIDLTKLLSLYFKTIDPTSVNKQGNDRGSQYRTGIYYTNTSEKPLIEKAIAQLATQYTQSSQRQLPKTLTSRTPQAAHPRAVCRNPRKRYRAPLRQ